MIVVGAKLVPMISSSSSTREAQNLKISFASSIMSTRSSGVKIRSAAARRALNSALMSSPSWGPGKCQKESPWSCNVLASS